jgi:hypothetical protein
MVRLLSNKDFNRKFQPIFRELELVQQQIEQKKGWFIFKTHVWTKEELLKSEHMSKINSISEKIADDIENWETNKQLSPIEKMIYHTNRARVEKQLHATKLQIGNREETFWAKFADSFGQMIPLIMDKLPDIISGNIPLKLLGNAIIALLPGSNHNNRKLPAFR